MAKTSYGIVIRQAFHYLLTNYKEVFTIGQALHSWYVHIPGYACRDAVKTLTENKIECEVIDLRVLNPLDTFIIAESVKKTGRLCVVDGGWKICGLAGEVISSVVERLNPNELKTSPVRITLPDTPAPTSQPLEKMYYPDTEEIITSLRTIITG